MTGVGATVTGVGAAVSAELLLAAADEVEGAAGGGLLWAAVGAGAGVILRLVAVRLAVRAGVSVPLVGRGLLMTCVAT